MTIINQNSIYSEYDCKKTAVILAVDDTPVSLEIVKTALIESGFTVLTAATGEDALEQVNHTRPDLILLDVMMPGIDGFETCRILKADKNTRDIPVIFMTALTKTTQKTKAFIVGAVDYITKPIEKHELIARISTHLKIQKYQEHLEKEVYNRTVELKELTDKLQKELAEHKRTDKALQELQEQLNHVNKLDAIGQLAGGIAHDFNNILAGIMGACQLLMMNKKEFSEKNIKFLDLIMSSSTRATNLTSKLLTFARKGKIVSATVNIHTAIYDTVSIISNTIDKKIKITITCNAKNYLITGDSSDMQNTFVNLCINASHAMPDGGEIQIETRNILLDNNYCDSSPFDIDPGEYIDIEVRDTGCGIPLDKVKKIFDPFYTTKEQGKGTGLGLSSVYGTILNHQGEINVYSEVNSGTVFHIYLPCSKKNIDKLTNPYEITKELKNNEILINYDSQQILLVDDEEVIRITGKHLLEGMGFKVLVAGTGKEALDIFQENHDSIDLVIMDMIMPEINGREAFFGMKKINPDCKIIISSGEDEVLVNAYLESISNRKTKTTATFLFLFI